MGSLFSFQGRVGRGGFWLGLLLNIVLALVGIGLAMLIAPVDFGNAAASPSPLFWGLYVVPALVGTWISVAASVKRLHDRGKSGWWYLLMMVLSLIIVGTIWYIVECGILEGQEGANTYGPDPRANTA
jgi:uncharacterized membrane protein YhaH (DUF805 family)